MYWNTIIGAVWLLVVLGLFVQGLIRNDSDYITGGLVLLIIISITVWIQ